MGDGMGWILHNQIFIQALGFVGLLIQVFSMQNKGYGKTIYMTISAELVFGVQLLLLGAYTGAATNFAACVTNLLYAVRIKQGKTTLPLQVIFSVLFVAIGIATWQGPASLLVIVAKMVSTVAYGIKYTKFIRISKLISMPLWLIYDLLSGSIGGVANDLLVIVSTVIGMVRLDRKPKQTDETTEA